MSLKYFRFFGIDRIFPLHIDNVIDVLSRKIYSDSGITKVSHSGLLTPFILKKFLDGQVGGSLEFIKKLRDGNPLVKVLMVSQIYPLSGAHRNI